MQKQKCILPTAFPQPFEAASLVTAFTRPIILLRTSFASGHGGRTCTDPEEIGTTLTKKKTKKKTKKRKKERKKERKTKKKKLVDNAGRFCFDDEK